MTRRSLAEWAALAGLSALLTGICRLLGAPAAILVGPMLAGIVCGTLGTRVRLSRSLFTGAQGVVGCLIASTISPGVLDEVARDGAALAFGVGSTIAASAAVGWASARFGSLPGSTAAWGSSAGAASAMVALAEEFGADPRLVAAMQYVRVICVVLTASVVSRWLTGPTAAIHAPDLGSAAPGPWTVAGPLATVGVAIAGSWLGRRGHIPAGGLLVPLALAAAYHLGTGDPLPTPPWLLTLAYVAIGWSIGLQFERATLMRSLRALPEILLASAALIALCGLAAWAMAQWMGYGALTAFLATSPGGIDTVAILALAGGADTPFVMSLQTLRVLAVVATGPAIARWIALSTRSPAA